MKIICTVTTDLTYDQRMIRICTSLATAGHEVLLVGRKLPKSKALSEQPYQQTRLSCFFQKGKFFYIEYNIRLFFFLFFQKTDLLYAVDLDTILPAFLITKLRNKKSIYDAHEYFTETPEVVHRRFTKAIWERLASSTIPSMDACITVGHALAKLMGEKYGKTFHVVRNVPFPQVVLETEKEQPPVILYQGALNEGRGLEEMINAMPHIENAQLWLAGEGDLSQQLRQQVKQLKLDHKVQFLGYIQPKALRELTLQASIGLNLLENKGLSYYYSLANKAFDYIQAEVPSINMAFPEYEALEEKYGTFDLVENLETKMLVATIQNLLSDKAHYQKRVANCRKAKQVLHWEEEEKVLLNLIDEEAR